MPGGDGPARHSTGCTSHAAFIPSRLRIFRCATHHSLRAPAFNLCRWNWWTPRLEKLVARLRSFSNVNLRHVFCKQDGQWYTYSGASTAWKRGTQRAGIPNTQFRDLQAKTLTDVDERSGIIAAQRMGAHSTQAQTADYIRNKRATKSTATR